MKFAAPLKGEGQLPRVSIRATAATAWLLQPRGTLLGIVSFADATALVSVANHNNGDIMWRGEYKERKDISG